MIKTVLKQRGIYSDFQDSLFSVEIYVKTYFLEIQSEKNKKMEKIRKKVLTILKDYVKLNKLSQDRQP